MKIIATAVKGKDLQPGDLFSTANQLYWDNLSGTIGEKVYIRTDEPTPKSEEEVEIYRIAICPN